jgi:outer membrane murein-binding lipoprotein Lpp
MKRKNFVLPILILFLIVGCVLVVGCATTPVEQKITYLTTRDTLNGALANYSSRVKAMPVGVQKDAIKAEFNPIWKDAEKGLDAWGAIVKGLSTEDPLESIRLFTEAKNKLIELGIKYFGDKLFTE